MIMAEVAETTAVIIDTRDLPLMIDIADEAEVYLILLKDAMIVLVLHPTLKENPLVIVEEKSVGMLINHQMTNEIMDMKIGEYNYRIVVSFW